MFNVKFSLPRSPHQNLVLSRHLLVDKPYFVLHLRLAVQILKLALFYVQGLIEKDEIIKPRDDIDQNKLEDCIILTSLLSCNKPQQIAIKKKLQVHSVSKSSGQIAQCLLF